MIDYYKILGINENASQEDIKKAYRNLAKEYHPDVNPDKSAEEKFKEISNAYEVLSNPSEKQKFDNKKNNPFHDYYNNFNFNSQFGDIFNIYNSPQQENLDISTSVNVSLADVYNNIRKYATYNRKTICVECHGSGMTDKHVVVCAFCGGTGMRMEGGRNETCRFCKGTGKMLTTCSKCNGNKYYMEKTTVDIGINTYVITGNLNLQQRYGGNCSINRHGLYGSLLINIIFITDNKYKVNGHDLIMNLKVDFRTAIKGGVIEYDHLDGKKYSVRIPDKSNNGDKFKLKDMGLLINPTLRGNLIIHLELFIDYNNLDGL